MIYLFSKDSDSIDEIIDYLLLSNKKFIRIDEEFYDLVFLKLEINKSEMAVEFSCNGKIYVIDYKDTIYFGLGTFNFLKKYSRKVNPCYNEIDHNTIEQNNSIQECIEHFFYNHPKQINFFYSSLYLNKLYILHLASRYKISIPTSIVVANYNEVKKKFKSKMVVTKSISSSLKLYDNKQAKVSYTMLLNNQIHIPREFQPSLFQQAILNAIEIRVVFVDGKCYSAILHKYSSEMENNIVDIRALLLAGAYRLIPFNLPNYFAQKISKLLSSLKIKIASCDLLYDYSLNEYILIDVNPNSYYSWISKKCNYNIEYQIFKLIKSLDEKI